MRRAESLYLVVQLNLGPMHRLSGYGGRRSDVERDICACFGYIPGWSEHLWMKILVGPV